jgi:adenine deaminase
VVRDARILNTATGALDPAGDIAICGDTIVGVGESYRGRREIDAGGRVAAPGFVDTHLHVESSLVLPVEFERGVLPRGTTTAICDPHEIANVMGVAGVRYFLEASRSLAMTVRGRPRRRPRVPPARAPAQRLPGGRHPHRPRVHNPGGG